MARDIQREAFIERMEDFLHNTKYDHVTQLERIADNYPEERSLLMNYWNLAEFDSGIAEFFLNHPSEAFPLAEEVAIGMLPPDVIAIAEPKMQINVRLNKLPPETHKIIIRNLRANHLEKFIAIDGLVRNVTEVRPRLVKAVFKCSKCGSPNVVEQNDTILREPMSCDNEECRKAADKTRFELLTHKSEFIDTQTVTVQESPEGLAGGSAPQRLRIYIQDDICGIINPGDRVVLNGTLASVPKKQGGLVKFTDYDIVLQANSIERTEHAYEEIVITEEERVQIEQAARNEDILHHVRDSIAPSVYQMDMEKQALALQLFGGVTKGDAGSRRRGDIHILLIGDPGTAKSQLLRFISDLAPRGVFASGKAATKAGLTATAVKDEHDGRWTLEGGALVLADMGHVCIDEIDKMNEDDRSSMHEAMEQQSISVAKAGINATLQTRCSILAAANPIKGRFVQDKTVPEQINLSTTLLSRFDVIFPIYDIPDKVNDERLAEAILRGQRAQEIMRNIQDAPDSPFSPEDVSQAQDLEPYFSRDFLHKYIAHAKRTVFPVMSVKVLKQIKDFYVEKRTAGQMDNAGIRRVPMTARQLEALIRLSEASARMRLSSEVEMRDCDIAMEIFKYFMNKVASSQEGEEWDADRMVASMSATERNLSYYVRDTIADALSDFGKDGVPIAIIKTTIMQERNVKEQDVDKTLKQMERDGELYYPTNETVKLTHKK